MTGLGINISEARLKDNRKEENFKNMLQEEFFQKLISEKEKKAYERGLSEGRERGYKNRNEELLSIVSALQAVIEQIGIRREELVKEYEPLVLDLALKATEKILGHELVSGTAKLDRIIRPVLQQIPGATNLLIRLHPDDAFQFEEIQKIMKKSFRFAGIEFKEDAGMTKGGCFVETNIGMIDATLETRKEQVMSLLKKEDTNGSSVF